MHEYIKKDHTKKKLRHIDRHLSFVLKSRHSYTLGEACTETLVKQIDGTNIFKQVFLFLPKL